MLNQGQPDEAIDPLRSGVEWFRNRGGWESFPYYFLGAELLAVTLSGQDNLQAARIELEQAADRREMVNSFSAPLYQRIQARLALIYRELGRISDAEAIEAELGNALALADHDHPILIQIREYQDLRLQIE